MAKPPPLYELYDASFHRIWLGAFLCRQGVETPNLFKPRLLRRPKKDAQYKPYVFWRGMAVAAAYKVGGTEATIFRHKPAFANICDVPPKSE